MLWFMVHFLLGLHLFIVLILTICLLFQLSKPITASSNEIWPPYGNYGCFGREVATIYIGNLHIINMCYNLLIALSFAKCQLFMCDAALIFSQHLTFAKSSNNQINIIPNTCAQEALQTPALAQVWAV